MYFISFCLVLLQFQESTGSLETFPADKGRSNCVPNDVAYFED